MKPLMYNTSTMHVFRSCIESYRVKLCQENHEDKICYEKQILPAEGETRVEDTVTSLKMCSLYILHVFPLHQETEVRTKTTSFRTLSDLQNPAGVRIEVDTAADKVSWDWLILGHINSMLIAGWSRL